MICRFVIALALAGSAVARAAEGAIHLDADRLTGSLASGLVEASGNARFSGDNLLLTADAIRYEQPREAITASGHVVFTRGDIRLLADRLVFDRQQGSFIAENIRLGSHPYFVEGLRAEGSPTEITVLKARASYGEPGPWQPTITADTLVLAPGRQLRTENVSLGIGQAQPVPIPRYHHNLRAPLVGAVSFTGGFRRTLGAYVDGTLLLPVLPSVRAGADLGIFTNRGVMVGPSASYTGPDGPTAMRGHLRSGYINDHGDKKTDVLGRSISEDRAFAEWQHRQALTPSLTLAAQLNWWKDSEVLRDFRPRSFFPVQEPDTFVEAVHTGQNFFLSAFARLRPNRFQRVQERLPEIRFDLLPYALGLGFHHRFNASAALLREDPLPGSGDPERKADRLDAYYGLARPIQPAPWLAITPVAGGRLTHYVNSETGGVRHGNYLRLLGELGADAALRTSGTFDYRNPLWRIDGLRHLFTPTVGYRYIPEAAKGRAWIPRIDREVFSTYLPPLGLGAIRHLDDLHATHTLRLGFDNVLQTRDTVEGTRDLLVLNLANDFRLRRRPGERDVSELHAELALTPATWLQVDVYQSFRPQTGSLREFNSGVTLRDGRFWSLRFSNNFLRDALQDYAIDGRVRLNERYEAVTRLHYDARRRRFNEQSYGIAQNLGNTWLISYSVSLYSGRRRESSFGLNVRVDTVRF